MATLKGVFGDTISKEKGDCFSFLPALYGKNVDDKQREGVVPLSDAGFYSIIRDNWKLVLHEGALSRRIAPKDAPVKFLGKIQLFNVAKDPNESVNIKDKYPQKVEEQTNLKAVFVNNCRSRLGDLIAFENDMNKVKRRQLKIIK
ncbi:hypothetical protein K4L44_06465 [Halosquirtibacter laminarini]|uniref:Uncharacterized protein n=1 Tax=Halosquirtibacter laminarini TaxID=3374600 RepID=A0AC61NPW9_9BACT|nr:hypothetical protein K4L44_06465 [Prolixibacteraceae bacterium]